MSGRRRAGAAAITLLALFAAWAAWGNGLDRMSRGNPTLARLVPDPFRSEAWRSESAAALRRQRPQAALAAAERAVAADPIDAASSSALGAARLFAGDSAGALAAFQVAGRLGWRDRPTQVFWLAVALDAGDFAVAAERADALLRQQKHLPEAAQLLAQLEAHPAGRRALAGRLGERPLWFDAYWSSLDGMSGQQLADRAKMLDEPAVARTGIACQQVAPLAGALLASGRTGEAGKMSQRYCGSQHRQRLGDGGFERARLSGGSTSDWLFPGEGGLDVRIEPAPPLPGRALVVDSNLPARRVFAAQALRLSAGRYRVSWRARADGGSPAGRIVARIACARGSGTFLETASSGDDRFHAEAEVPATCPAPWLELAIVPGEGAIAVDDVTIEELR